MKVFNKVIMMLSLTGVILSSCSSDDKAPSQEEKQLKMLADTWVVTSATMDGGDITSDYSSFELSLSGSASEEVYDYGVVGRPELSPWPSGGTWSFGSDLKSDLVRDPNTGDVLHMDYTVTKTQLTIEFMFNGLGYNASRVNSVEGNWVYTFTKK